MLNDWNQFVRFLEKPKFSDFPIIDKTLLSQPIFYSSSNVCKIWTKKIIKTSRKARVE